MPQSEEVPPTLAEQEPIEPQKEKTISRFCKINLRIESWLNSIFTLIIAAPVLLIAGLIKVIGWIATHTVPFLEWIGTRLLIPVGRLIVWLFIGIGKAITWISVGIGKGIWYFCKGIAWAFGKINWCAVRSLTRMFSLIGGVVAGIWLVYTIYTHPGVQVITGKFSDADPAVCLMHTLIAAIMIAVTAYYNAWAFSKAEEINFVSKRTCGLNKIKEQVKRLLK